jgi:phosphonate transport system permease protein
VRYWLKPKFWWLYTLAAIYLLPESPTVHGSTFWQFFSQDIWPKALLRGDLSATVLWLDKQFWQVAWPAMGTTLALTQIALVLTGILTLVLYPLATKAIVSSGIRLSNRFVLLFLRSMPELMLAFVFLLLFGPSALAAVFALALHNAGLIAFLLANASEAQHKLNATSAYAKRAFDRYGYQELPQRYATFLAFLFYRWEVILRESAIMGVLGIATLGFYVDSAFEDIRFERAFFLIIITALLNITVDSVSRGIRQRAGLTTANLAVR